MPIGDVHKYRGEISAAVSKASSHFDLDLSAVDLASDPLLSVDGTSITQADLGRQIAFSFGANEIEQFLTGVMLRRVKAELAATGKPVAPTTVSDEEVKAKFEADKQVVPQMRGMTPEQYEKAILEGIGWPRYVEFQRQQLEFERFFLPDPPEDWAKQQRELTRQLEAEEKKKAEAGAAGNAGGGGELPASEGTKEGSAPAGDEKKPTAPPVAPPADLSFIPDKTWELMDPRTAETLKLNYARGHGLHPLMRSGLIASFRKKLLSGVEVRAGRPDEPGVAVACGGETLAMTDLLALLGNRLEDAAKRVALRELVNLRAVDVRLRKAGVLLAESDAESRLAEWRKKYDGSLISSDQILQAYGYNSIWHYREVFRRKQSFRDLTLTNLSDEKLKQHYDMAGRVFFESGTCIGQILFVPAADRKTGREAIDALLAEVAAGTRSFAAVCRANGTFPDSADVKSGAIAPIVRNKLRSALQESDYLNFLTGHSFADEAFYSAREGQILGPVWRDSVPERTGWYALHVDRWFTTGNRAPLGDAKARDRAIDDLIDVTFPRYVNEAVAAASIELPNPR
jgi:hypothetical protein